MALSYEEFVKATGAEVVAGNLIVGIMANRKIVGSILDGTFNLNDDGRALADEIEARNPATSTGRRRRSENQNTEAVAAGSADAAE